MVYPWSKKPKDEETSKDEKTLDEDKASEDEKTLDEDKASEDEKTLDEDKASEDEKTLDKEETSEDGQGLDDVEESNGEVSEDEGAPSDVETSDNHQGLILNILKLEEYKMNSGELFQAFREAGGEMQDFKDELDRLSETGKIKSDSDGNIMTVQDFKHEKSQQEEEHTSESEEENIKKVEEKKGSEEKDETKDTEDEAGEETTEEVTDKDDSEQSSAEGDEDIESIIKLKEETDNWLIEQLKNKGNSNGDDSLKAEVAELKDRVHKLENVIKNITKAFE
uniref:Reverse transcriptase n=1 Tax=uncultured marine group II/III euryarchaeote AD1000_39_C04 TaxID=1457762 RepID=A0A075FQQ3_9EURY|nr:reverse transcriptase [uncultured marine group II/III euryarchaeote AD1000_39_C04]